MAATLPARASSTPRNPIDCGRPRMAKAGVEVNADQFRLTAIVRDGLIRACGSLKAAAITMQMDQGQLSRDLQTGAFKFERLERLSQAEQSVVFELLHNELAPLSTPKARAKQKIREARAALDELDQALELIA